MKTGIELIAQERREQIEKHGFTLEKDAEFYEKGELVQGALCALEKVGRGPGFTNVEHHWPDHWDLYFENKLRLKSDISKLIVAGAFYMAENDRIGKPQYQDEINKIAAEIDRLQNAPV